MVSRRHAVLEKVLPSFSIYLSLTGGDIRPYLPHHEQLMLRTTSLEWRATRLCPCLARFMDHETSCSLHRALYMRKE